MCYPFLGGRDGFAAQWPRIPAELDDSQLEAGNKRGAGQRSLVMQTVLFQQWLEVWCGTA